MFNRTRMTLLLALVAVMGFAAIAGAPTQVAIGTVHQPLYDIAFEGARGIAVGADGRMLVSDDAGQNWRTEKSVTTSSLLGVAMRGTHGIAVGQSGLVLIRNGDGGWRSVKVDTTERLLAVAMNSSGLAVIVGGFGTMLKSSDFGETWHNTMPDWPSMFADHVDTLGPAFGPHLYGVSVSEQGEVRVVGELSVIVASNAKALEQGGRSWRLVHRGDIVNGRADPSLFGIHMRADGIGFAFGQSGRVLRTRDNGMSWLPIDVGTDAILLAAASGKPGHLLLIGVREMLSSEDDGLHWQHAASLDATGEWFVAAARSDKANATFVVGEQGKILSFPD